MLQQHTNYYSNLNCNHSLADDYLINFQHDCNDIHLFFITFLFHFATDTSM